MISTSEALTGPWAANVRGGVLTAIPLSLLAVSQELIGAELGPGAIVASVLLQFVASVAWAGIVAGISRRLSGRVTAPALAIMWTGFGVTRGLAGGIVAALNGFDPDWSYRVVFWTGISLIWIPIITFGLAQLESRQRLLRARGTTRGALAAATTRAAESAEARDRRLGQAIDDALRPALDEIRDSLRHPAAAMDEETMEGLVARIDELAARTQGFSTPTPEPEPERYEETRSLRMAAEDFELRRPVVASLVAALATAAFVFPEALREGGWPHVAEAAVAIAVAGSLMYGAIVALRPFPGTRSGAAVRRVSIAVGALAGAAMLAVLPWEPFEPRDLIMIGVFPLLFATAASVVAIAVALARTNAELGSLNAAERATLARRLAEARAADERAAAGLVTLVRGELNGRLAACAMALSFLASGSIPPRSRAAALRGVVAQLDAASDELGRVIPH